MENSHVPARHTLSERARRLVADPPEPEYEVEDAARHGDSYDPQINPDGYISLCIAENRLVAGLMLELVLTNPHLLEESGSSRHLVKDSLKSTLAVQLAGHIPLASFHTLAQGLDRWFEALYPLIAGTGRGRSGSTPPSTSPSPRKSLLREDLFYLYSPEIEHLRLLQTYLLCCKAPDFPVSDQG